MNKLVLTHIGGHPLRLQDLKFMQDANFAAFAALSKGFIHGSEESFILGGLETTPGSGVVSFSEGWISYKGELMYVAASPNVSTADDIVIAPVSTFPSPNPLTYKDLSTKNVREVRTAIVTNLGSLTEYISYPKPIERLIGNRINDLNGSWQVEGIDFTLTSNCTVMPGSGYGDLQTVKFRKTWDGYVEFVGGIKVLSISSGAVDFFTVPSGYEPPHDINASLMCYNSSTDGIAIRVRVKSDGTVQQVWNAGLVNLAIDFSGLKYLL
jgi:hypothetical protein